MKHNLLFVTLNEAQINKAKDVNGKQNNFSPFVF